MLGYAIWGCYTITSSWIPLSIWHRMPEGFRCRCRKLCFLRDAGSSGTLESKRSSFALNAFTSTPSRSPKSFKRILKAVSFWNPGYWYILFCNLITSLEFLALCNGVFRTRYFWCILSHTYPAWTPMIKVSVSRVFSFRLYAMLKLSSLSYCIGLSRGLC